jgi:hypothetical protein
MASDKYFLFRREDITDYSEIFSNNGENLSILAVRSSLTTERTYPYLLLVPTTWLISPPPVVA